MKVGWTLSSTPGAWCAWGAHYGTPAFTGAQAAAQKVVRRAMVA
ncbi:hypothetical protein [Acidovorax sp. A1169]|nr:hypothetical protein [Acidovorax sp. A1169]MDP4074618.1 hypothetical protein [Acidovorax sp. A1169]